MRGWYAEYTQNRKKNGKIDVVIMISKQDLEQIKKRRKLFNLRKKLTSTKHVKKKDGKPIKITNK